MNTEIILENIKGEKLYDSLLEYSTTSITKLDLSLCDFNDQSLQLCVSILKQSKATLSHVSIGGNDSLVCKLLPAIQECSNISLLQLQGSLTDTVISTLDELCPTYMNNILTFEFFSAEATNGMLSTLVKFLAKCNKLLHFTLSFTSASSCDIGLLMRFLKHNTTIERLNLLVKVPQELWDDCFVTNRTITSVDPFFTSVGSTTFRIVNLNHVCKQLKATETERQSVPLSLQTRDEMARYLEQLIEEGERWNTLKLIVLGHGEVGKTTLLHKMHKIHQWQFPLAKETRFNPSRTIGAARSTLKIGKGQVSVWDFGGQLEYSVTHQFLLSSEMVVYILCYDLSATAKAQHEQVSYWLDFLQSTLPCSFYTIPNWSVVMVGTKSDACSDLASVKQLNPIPAWQRLWPKLPLHQKRFIISSHSKSSIQKLFQSLEAICNQIFQNYTLKIPKSYQTLLTHLQKYAEQHPIVPLSQLEANFAPKTGKSRFQDALRHLHAIGQVVWITRSSPQMVCLVPEMIPKIAAEFVSPANVRSKLINVHRIEVLETNQIATILDIGTEDIELQQKLALMQHFGVCFKLISEKGSIPSYLFPSLGLKSDNITFTVSKISNMYFCGLRVTAPQNLIFTAGFFCTLITDLFRALNITKQELIRVHANGVVFTCRGMFTGQLILKVEQESKSLVLLLLALNPDLSFAEHILETMIQQKFVQYAGFVKQRLCPVCVEEFTARSDDMGIIEDGIHSQRCQPHMHNIIKCGMPIPDPLSLVHECYTHKQTKHHFFLSYRVATEGEKSRCQTKEAAGGFVELIYEHLAPQKIGTESLFVFWDKKCLKMGQDWEAGFLHGLTSSSIIVLLLSNKVIEGICSAAPTKQDNVLLEYECALLQNITKGVPVIPLFAAEMKGDDQFEAFDFRKANSTLPDVPHLRSANHVISNLSQSLPPNQTEFLTSIKKTMDKIFRLQGVFLPKRGEDQKAIDEFIEKAINTVQDYL